MRVLCVCLLLLFSFFLFVFSILVGHATDAPFLHLPRSPAQISMCRNIFMPARSPRPPNSAIKRTQLPPKPQTQTRDPPPVSLSDLSILACCFWLPCGCSLHPFMEIISISWPSYDYGCSFPLSPFLARGTNFKAKSPLLPHPFKCGFMRWPNASRQLLRVDDSTAAIRKAKFTAGRYLRFVLHRPQLAVPQQQLLLAALATPSTSNALKPFASLRPLMPLLPLRRLLLLHPSLATFVHFAFDLDFSPASLRRRRIGWRRIGRGGP